jgi:hypothetical protein
MHFPYSTGVYLFNWNRNRGVQKTGITDKKLERNK